MKKLLLSLLALMAIGASAMADEVSIPAVNIYQGASNYAEFTINITSGAIYKSIAFDMILPDGISIAADEEPINPDDPGSGVKLYPQAETGEAGSTLQVQGNYVDDNLQHVRFAGFIYSIKDSDKFSSGCIVKMKLIADESLEPCTLEASIQDIHIATSSGQGEDEFKPANFNFTINILEPLVLDEMATTPPDPTADEIPFTVKRTIFANEWSTICLPFNMNEAQLKDAFGEDVQLAMLVAHNGFASTFDDEDNITAIKILFQSVDLNEEGLEANIPYLIKVSSPISSFEVTAKIEPESEEDLVWETDNGKTGNRRQVLGTFYGTYHAETIVPNNCLFLSGNNFWYSKGNTKMKAFRGYFDLTDILTVAENANVKLQIAIDDEPTSVNNIQVVSTNGATFTIDGKKMNSDVTKLPKGVYIIDGKKVAIK